MELPDEIVRASVLAFLTPERIAQIAEKVIREQLQLVTVGEAKDRLRIGINQARALPLPRVMLSDKKIRYTAADLETYIRNNTEK